MSSLVANQAVPPVFSMRGMSAVFLCAVMSTMASAMDRSSGPSYGMRASDRGWHEDVCTI